MEHYIAKSIIRTLISPRFYPGFAASINQARDAYFSDDDLAFDVQDIALRIACDLDERLSPVWHSQAERLTAEFGPLPPITPLELVDVLLPQLAGFALEPGERDSAREGLLRLYFLLSKLFPEDDVLSLYQDAAEVDLLDFPGSELKGHLLGEFESIAIESFVDFWGVVDLEIVAIHQLRQEEEAKQNQELMDFIMNLDLSDLEDISDSGRCTSDIPRRQPGASKKNEPLSADKDSNSIRRADSESTSEAPSTDLQPSRLEELKNCYKECFWNAEGGASILLLPVPSKTADYNRGDRTCCIKVMLDGAFTELALQQAIERLRPIVTTLVYLIEVALAEATDFPLLMLHSAAMRKLFQRAIDLHLSRSLDTEDELGRRLHNAISLVGAEQSIPSDRLGLALCFGAIEAMLTTSGPGATAELKDYTAALLQPSPEKRKGAATEIGKLYERRNEIVHGRWVTPQPEDADLRAMARTLAVGVLLGVVQASENWQWVQGTPMTIKDLHDELVICHRKEQAMVGVDGLSTFLPNNVPKSKVGR